MMTTTVKMMDNNIQPLPVMTITVMSEHVTIMLNDDIQPLPVMTTAVMSV